MERGPRRKKCAHCDRRIEGRYIFSAAQLSSIRGSKRESELIAPYPRYLLQLPPRQVDQVGVNELAGFIASVCGIQ